MELRQIEVFQHVAAQGSITRAAEDLFLSPGARRDAGQLYESMTLDEAERHLIQRALSRCAGNVSEAARDLGVSRSALYRRLQHHGLKAQG